MGTNDFSPQVSHLWLVRIERTSILLFWARLVIGWKRLGGSGWVRYHCNIGHMIKYDAFRVNRDQVIWTLKYGSKSIQTFLILRQRLPKPYKLLKFLINFVTTVKSRHAPTIWKKLRWKLLCLPILNSITEIIKMLRVWGTLSQN